VSLISRLGFKPTQNKSILVPKKILANDISIIIPVKNNQHGITRLLNTFENIFTNDTLVKEIIIIDNLSQIPIKIHKNYSFNIQLTSCDVIGPAAARNKGVSLSNGNWLLFLDSDCLPTKNTILGYLSNNNTHLAYAGNIQVVSKNKLSKYYETQEILIPPEAIDNKIVRPDYLVTANCLVYKNAFKHVDGFDEKFKQAGGEDIDLGFRLLSIGSIAYQWNSVVLHNFDDGIKGFVERFNRYGKGNKQLAKKYMLNLSPRPFLPKVKTTYNIFLAFMQFLSMSKGYHLSYKTNHRSQSLTQEQVNDCSPRI